MNANVKAEQIYCYFFLQYKFDWFFKNKFIPFYKYPKKNFSNPILFNNSANPITLCYVNSDLVYDYTLPDDIVNISYNGKLLKQCNITLNSITCKLSFLVTIVNNLDETYTCPIVLNIPLSTEKSTIYDGNLILNQPTNYRFVRNYF